jgi:signal transduction histidine kinase/DNA-binding NarL/FixJ family response regulator
MNAFHSTDHMLQFRRICDVHCRVVPGEILDLQHACAMIDSTFSKHQSILPFTLLYLMDEVGSSLTLKSQVGEFTGVMDGNTVLPSHIVLNPPTEEADAMCIATAVKQVMKTQHPVDLSLDEPFCQLFPQPHRTGPPPRAIALPITPLVSSCPTPSGVVLFGFYSDAPLSSTNTAVLHFMELLCSQTAAIISTVKIHEASQQYLRRQLDIRTAELLRTHNAAGEAHRLRAEEAEKNAKYHIEFSRMLAHEIRNPLQASSCSVDLLQNELTARQAILNKPFNQLTLMDFEALRKQVVLDKECLESIEASVKHQSIVTNGVLEAAKIDANKMVLADVEFNVGAKVKEVINMLKPQASHNHTKMYLNALTDDIVIYGDPDRLSQVLVNVIVNALKFTKHGCVTVSLDVKETIGKIATVVINVEDTGIGMNSEQIDKLFQRFSQVTSTSFHQLSGTGLGLYYCKRFIEMMDGDIRVTSQPGKGTVFSITFKGRIAKASPPSPSPRHMSNGVVCRSNNKVLVVEDNAINQQLLCRMLRHEGYKCTSAFNGAEALSLLRQHQFQFDLIFMDIQMPVMDGITCTIAIRQQEKEYKSRSSIPIICLTGDNDQMEACRQAGMNQYLQKPCSRSTLQAVLRAVTVSRSLEAIPSQQSSSPSSAAMAPVVNLQVNMFVNAQPTKPAVLPMHDSLTQQMF